MRFFQTSFLLLYLFQSCGSLPETKWNAVKETTKTITIPYFTRENIVYSYRTVIGVYGHNVSGIVIMKKISDETFRVAMTTEFGNTLFDIEISPTEQKVKTIVADLDRKIVVNTLVWDFRLLLKKSYTIGATFSDGAHLISRSNLTEGIVYLYQTAATDVVFKMEDYKGNKRRRTLGFVTENNIFARKISIEHDDIDMKIMMDYFSVQ